MNGNGVKDFVRQRIEWLERIPEPQQKAMLANLRRGIGRSPGDMPELWGVFLQDMPPEMQQERGDATREEWAIYLALTLYALHQQGYSISKNENMNQEGVSLGNAVGQLIKPEEDPVENSVLRRFNALATASDIRECAHHLRGMVQLLRANTIPLDYPKLAQDLYVLQFKDSAPNVRLHWGQDYYRVFQSKEKKEKKDE
ncbi:MAG: type I-E CRISPR-associated protein Cse2/CasB [Lachnospirales bacterium]